MKARLREADGRMLVRNCFADDWPTRVTDDAIDGDAPPAKQPAAAVRVPGSESVRVLVIGNQRYDESPLDNTERDAEDFGKMVSSLGYIPEVHTNLNLRKMKEVINSFAESVGPRDGVLFYYSGHGAECEGDNWLIPIDCNSDDPDDFVRQSISQGKIAAKFDAARFRITILDACRNNPYKGLSRGGSGGLRAINLPRNIQTEGDLICYATAPHEYALDSVRGNRNGPFTKALLKHFKTPGLSIHEVMRRVRTEVKEQTKGRQVPWSADCLSAEWHPAGRPAA